MGREMHIDLDIVENLSEAGVLVTSKNYYRRRPQKVRDAESAHLPVYVLRSNTPPQMRQFLSNLYPSKDEEKTGSFKTAIDEAEEAVTQVNEGQEAVELSPQSSYIRRLQHLIAQRSDLSSHSYGKDPNRRVRIYKERTR
jgi:PHD/YefM family antitoxin component YafN of YafNO toxin-antitoxin module